MCPSACYENQGAACSIKLLWQAHTVVGLEGGCEYIAGYAMKVAVAAVMVCNSIACVMVLPPP